MTLRIPHSILKMAVGVSLVVTLIPSIAKAQEIQFRDGRFLEMAGGVTIQRADEASSDEAVRNMPFLPGDRVWTDDRGRAEIVFAEGEVLWIAERSKVDSLGRGGREQDERLGLRVYAGSFGVRVRSGGPGFEIQVAGGVITTTGASAFRVDVRSGETLLTVNEGAVLANLGDERLSVRSGERARFADGRADGPFQYLRTTDDGFDRWCHERSQALNRMARDYERLPDELDAYGDELEQNGEWVYDEPQGYVYVPRVAADWAPYTYGRWVYTAYGWTWVDDQPWGFVTSHYGRWGYSSRVGWHWMPRLGFSGAWVGWSSPVGTRWTDAIGWCALGFNDRPVSSFAFSSGNYGGRRDARRGWSFANRSDLGRGSISRKRLDIPAEEASRAVAWNPNAAPDRDFRERQRQTDARAVGRSGGSRERAMGRDDAARIYVRPSPGDSTSELRSDPMTTIPTPESRRKPTIGQDGFKDDQNRTRRDDSTWGVYGGASVESSRERRGLREKQTDSTGTPARGGARDDGGTAGQGQGQKELDRPGRDPLLNRFFRSITRPNATESESAQRNDDSGARRREPSSRDAGRTQDDSSAKASEPRERPQPRQVTPSSDEGRERSRPSGTDGRERARPAGGDRSAPRSSSPPIQKERSGSSGSSDDRGARRRPNNQ